MTTLLNLSQTCSNSTTASNSDSSEKYHFQGDVICDWLSFKHNFSPIEKIAPIESGKTLKLNIDGEIEWETNDYENIKCASSDTNVRIKFDGHTLKFSGNIGRFQNNNNIQGHPVKYCIDKAISLIYQHFPRFENTSLGKSIYVNGKPEGFAITRIDLASNFITNSYSQIATLFASRKINRKLPIMGKYGPTWGYDAKRSQYWKAKLYDKQAEQDGKHSPYTNETLARFEIQLGSEYLRQNNLTNIKHWDTDMKNENIIYGKFANQLLKQQATVETWSDMPLRLRHHAIMYRDGIDPKSYLKQSQYYNIKSKLLEYGLDISRPCNVMNLVQRIKTIDFSPTQTFREVA
jgi:hypothetical protein